MLDRRDSAAGTNLEMQFGLGCYDGPRLAYERCPIDRRAGTAAMALVLASLLSACSLDDRAPSLADSGPGSGDRAGGGGSGAAGASGAGGGAGDGAGGEGEPSGAGGRDDGAGGAGGGSVGQGGTGAGQNDGGNGGNGGSAALPAECAVEVVTSVPFSASWSSVSRPDLYDGGCDTLGTPDYALVFIAPRAGTFRVISVALADDVPYTGTGDPSGVPDGPADGDSVMTVVRGSCAGEEAQQVACNDDAMDGVVDSQLDLSLSMGETVTIYLNELTQTGGGTGTVSIDALP